MRFLDGKYQGAEYPVAAAAIRIGRHPDGDMVLLDDAVSETHARITLDANGIWLEDLGSEGGTWVNGQRIERVALALGDRIAIASHVMELKTSDRD